MNRTLPSPNILAGSIFTLIAFLTDMRIPAEKKNIVKATVSLTSVALLLVSSAVLTMLGSAADTNGQSGDRCKKLNTAGISESGHNFRSIATRAIDGQIDTRWANKAAPSYLQVDLGQKSFLCSIDISWYRGEFRSYNFALSISDDGVNFKDIITAKSTGETSLLERYNLANSQARYVKVSVFGNTESDGWASINELSVNGLTCSAPQVSRVTASGDDGNVPQNTLDNNPGTRWSNFGFPSWIQYDLSESQPICNVDIAWYRGDLRANTFTVSASNDGVNFTPIFSGQSSGKTIGPERYDVLNTMGKYLRITVTGNTENSWSSITEVRINGGGIPIPDPNPVPNPNPDPAGTDPFGIQKIYPTKTGGEEWFMDMRDGQDSRSKPPSMTKNSDGSFKVTSSQVRYGVFTTDGYDPDEVELDHGILAQRGYMQSPKDWKNVELTGYVKVNKGQSGENFAWYARGGRHTGSGSPEGCEGSAYKPDLFYDGRVRFAKEQWHVSYVFTDHKRPIDSIEDRWVGFKGVMWNEEQNGETVVKMEIWVDNNEDGKQDGPWVKVDENIDSGGWGSEGEECGGASDQIITWGGPVATFRWDGASDVDIKNFSVREIQPPS
jgi:hypothetical protein